MNLFKYIPLQLLLYLIIGICIGLVFSPPMESVSIILIILITVLYILNWQNLISLTSFKTYHFFTLLIFIGIGIICENLNNSFNAVTHYSKHIKTENTAKIRLTERKKSNSVFHNYIAEVEGLNGKNVIGKIKVNIPINYTRPLGLGDLFTAVVNFSEINAPLNPYEFNYQNFLLSEGVKHQIYLNSAKAIYIQTQDKSSGWSILLKNNITKALVAAGFKGDELNLINALLLGQRSGISAELIKNYQKAGAIHILAISGLHIGILLMMFNFLLTPLLRFKNGKLIRLCLVIILLWSFAFLAGLSASVIRATTMFTAIAIGLLKGNKISTYKALIISMFFLLLFKSNYLLNVGFQLSYVAVFFIVWLQPIFSKIWKPRYRIINYPWQLFTVSLAAQIGVLPLSLYYFHQFPGLFFLSNLVVIPFLGIILALGILVIFLSLLNILPDFLQKGYELFIQGLNQFITWVGGQESFLFENLSFSLISTILLYGVIFSLFYWVSKKRFGNFIVFIFMFLGFNVALILQKYHLQKDHWIVFNKSRESVIGISIERELTLYSSMVDEIEKTSLVKGYLVGTYAHLSQNLPLSNALKIRDTPILIIDQLAIVPQQKMNDPIVLLRESTPVNLDRFLQAYKPLMIIADASNYKGLIPLWEKTCDIYNIKFHYTVRDGAFLGQL